MKYILFFCCLPLAAFAQLFAGGAGSGYELQTFAGPDPCRTFFTGNSASGHSFGSFNNPFACGFSKGDSSSGAFFGERSTSFNCIEFKGSAASGASNNTFNNPFQCPQFFASPAFDDGFAARSFSESNAGACYVFTLPIEGSPLFVKLENNQAKLSWTTYVEEFNAGFHVQKSLNAVDWYEIAWVNGQGFSNEEQNYTHYDASLNTGVQYYRYVQEDFDGNMYISNVVSLSTEAPEENQNFLALYPNPVRVGATLNIRSFMEGDFQGQFSIVNALGQIVYRQELVLSAQFAHQSIPMDDFPPGHYVCILHNNSSNQHFHQKLIIVK